MAHIDRQPSIVDTGDGSLSLNFAAMIRWLWELDLTDVGKPDMRHRLRAWRDRVETMRRANVLLQSPLLLEDLLWQEGNGDELMRRVRKLQTANPGAKTIRTDFDLFDVMLGPDEDQS